MKSIEIMNRNYSKPSRLIYFTIPYLIIALLSLKTNYFRYVAFCFVLMFIVTFILAKKDIQIKRKYLLLFWFITGYTGLGFINGDPFQTIKNINMFILSLAPFFIFDWVFSNARVSKRKQNSKILFKIMTPILIYTVIATLYYLINNPYIARNMANFDPSLGRSNVDLPTAIGGGYVLIYGLILLPPIFLFLTKNMNIKVIWKFLFFTIFLFLLYFIIKSGFATAFIISIASSILSILLIKKQKKISRIALILIIFIGLIIILNVEILSSILHIITNILPEGSIISIRLNEIVPSLYGNSNDTSFSSRLMGLEKTTSAFFGNLILGVGYKVGFDYFSVSALTGLHTEWLDILSQYGLFLGVPILLFIAISLKELIKLFKGTSMEQIVKLVVGIIIVSGFLNPIMNTSIFIIAMVYIPSLLTLLLIKEEKIAA